MQFRQCLSMIVICLLLSACAGARMAQQLQAGKSSFQSGAYKDAFHQLLPLAVKGSPDAQYAVGYMYYYGYGVSEDSESGMFWMTKSAEQHYPPALKALELIQHPTAESQSIVPVRQSSAYEAHREKILRQPESEYVPIVSSPPPTKKLSYIAPEQARKYALQLYGSYHLHAVKDLQSELRLKNTGHIYQTQHQGKDWYVLTFGNFVSTQEATGTQKNLPSGLKNMHPWVRNLDTLRLV